MRRAPSAVARPDAASRAQGAQDLRIAVGRDERRAARDLRQRAISELDWKAHAVASMPAVSYLPFAASAAATSASALASFVAPMMNVGVEPTPVSLARS